MEARNFKSSSHLHLFITSKRRHRVLQAQRNGADLTIHTPTRIKFSPNFIQPLSDPVHFAETNRLEKIHKLRYQNYIR